MIVYPKISKVKIMSEKVKQIVTTFFLNDVIEAHEGDLILEYVPNVLRTIDNFMKGEIWVRLDKSGRIICMELDKHDF